MRPRRTHASTAVYRLPGGTEDNDLWVEKTFSSEDPDQPVICSVWEPSDDERQQLAAGGNVELVILGAQQPPVALQVTMVTLGKGPSPDA